MLFRHPISKARTYQSRKVQFAEGPFQWRYTSFLVFSLLAAGVVAMGPIFYFVNQNFEIFIELAHHHAPDLVAHLEREKFVLFGCLGVSLVVISLFAFYASLRIARRVMHPLKVLERHIGFLSEGNYQMPEIQLRKEDEVKELVASYNYLYRSLRVNFEQELKDLAELESTELSAKQRELIRKWVTIRRQQLGKSALTEVSSKTSGVPSSLRAS